MRSLKIAFCGCDYLNASLSQLFQEALPAHPEAASVDWDWVFSIYGQKPANLNQVGKDFIFSHLKDYDLIFLNTGFLVKDIEGAWRNDPQVERMFTDLGVWKKLVLLDVVDDQKIYVYENISRCLLYVKHSWQEGFLPQDRSNLIPLDFGILKPYLEVVPVDYYPKRDLHITCTLPQTNRHADGRTTIVQSVKHTNWYEIEPKDWVPFEHGVIQVTLCYTCGWQSTQLNTEYRNLMIPEDFPRVNWWYIYQHLLKRTQILFTGTAYSAKGDNRTWEAFASGALVFIDDIPVPSPDPLIEGQHYFKFDQENPMNSLKLAKQLLMDDTERTRIARAGFEHAVKYHGAHARVRRIMEKVGEKLDERDAQRI